MFTLISTVSINLFIAAILLILLIVIAVVNGRPPVDSAKDLIEKDPEYDQVIVTHVEPIDDGPLYRAMYDPMSSINSPTIITESKPQVITKSKTTVQTKYSGPKYSRITTKDVSGFMRLNQVSGSPGRLTESELNAILKDIASTYRSAKESPYIFYTKESLTNIAHAIGFKTQFILSEYLKGSKVSKNNKDLIELYFKNNVKNYMLAPTGISKSDSAPEQK